MIYYFTFDFVYNAYTNKKIVSTHRQTNEKWLPQMLLKTGKKNCKFQITRWCTFKEKIAEEELLRQYLQDKKEIEVKVKIL